MLPFFTFIFLVPFSAAFAKSTPALDQVASKSAPAHPGSVSDIGKDLELPAGLDSGAEEHCRLELNTGRMAIEFDQSKWRDGKVEDGRYSLNHASGNAFAFVIAEPVVVDLDALPEIALSHARATDPDAKMILREKRIVNGTAVWCLKLEFRMKSIPFTYYGYYYGGKAGTVQIVTCTRQNMAQEYESDFQEFLNGFRVAE